MRRALLVATLACLAVPTAALGAAGSAVRHVRDGIERFHQADYKGAAQAFADADLALPEDPTIAFDQACVRMAQGDTEQAIKLLKTAALCRNATLAAQSHYNLGCLKAAQAKAIFGAKPEEAAAEVRQNGTEKLAEAIGHYRDCLRVDPDHAAARHNLEVLRLWLKTMQDAWSQRDRQQQQTEMNLLQWLKMIQAQQRQLRESTRSLAGQPDSPRRRQAASAAETDQRKLASKIDPLKEKITSTLRPPAGPGAAASHPAPQSPGSDADRAVDLLTRLADKAAVSMRQAADRIGQASWEKAATRETKALDTLNEIYMAVAPFTDILQTATDTQQQLVDRSAALVQPGAGDNASQGAASPRAASPRAASPRAASPGDARKEDAGKNAAAAAEVDYDALAARQRRVEGWSEILPLKAKQRLKNLSPAGGHQDKDQAGTSADRKGQEKAPSVTAADQADEADEKDATAPAKAAKTDQPQAAALRKAVELGPKIKQLAAAAATELVAERAASAMPKQKEALQLLKQIAASLPNQKQKPKQKPPSPKQPRQNRQKPPPQQQAGGEKPNPQQSEPPRRQPRRNPSQQHAEAVMSKARERERQHRRLQKQLQGYLRSPVSVDKDW